MTAALTCQLLTQQIQSQVSLSNGLDTENKLWPTLNQLAFANVHTEHVENDYKTFVDFITPRCQTAHRLSRADVMTLLPLQLYARLTGVLHINVFSAFDSPIPSAKQVASVLFAEASFFNHSCQPNVELIHPLEHVMVHSKLFKIFLLGTS